MIIVLISLPVLFLVILMMKPFRRCSGRINKYHNKLSRYMMWGHPITVLYESYTMILICSLVNLMNPSYDGWSDIISTVFSLAMLSVCVFAPITFVVVMLRKFSYLERNKIKIRWGKIFEGLDLKRGKTVVLQMAHYFLRRFMLIVVIVCQDYIIVQIMTVFFSFVTELIILGFVRPFKDPFNNKMEYFNEVIILLTMYCLMCFTDWNPNIDMQTNIGWVICSVVGSHLLLNMFFMMMGNVKKVSMRCKRAIKIRAHKRMREEAIKRAQAR